MMTPAITADRRFTAAPQDILLSFWRHRGLIWQMTKRDIVGRYRGSAMGLLWSLFIPILMLAVYTFVFSVVFQLRWTEVAVTSKADFAIILFAGLIVHALFADCVIRSPSLVVGNVNYVRKVVFPLEILPWVAMGTALFHAMISVLVLLVFSLMVHGSLHWTALLLPVVLAPLVLLTMGVSWFLASVGVFVRDIAQITGVFTTVLLFLGPIFYPVSALPAEYQSLLLLNPLTFIIDQTRAVLLWGTLPAWDGLLLYVAAAAVFAWAGFGWFQITRRGFADVL